MQCEEAGDWLTVGAGLLSLVELIPSEVDGTSIMHLSSTEKGRKSS